MIYLLQTTRGLDEAIFDTSLELMWFDKDKKLKYAYSIGDNKAEQLKFIQKVAAKPRSSCVVISSTFNTNANRFFVYNNIFILQNIMNFTTEECNKIKSFLENNPANIENEALRTLLNLKLGSKCIFGWVDKRGTHVEFHGDYQQDFDNMASEKIIHKAPEMEGNKVQLPVIQELDIHKYRQESDGKIIRTPGRQTHCSLCRAHLGEGDNFYGILCWDAAIKQNDLLCDECYNWFQKR